MAFRRTAILGSGNKIVDTGLLSWRAQHLFDKYDDGTVVVQVQRDAFSRRPGGEWSGRNLLCDSNVNIRSHALRAGGEAYAAGSPLLILGLLAGAGPTEKSRSAVVAGRPLTMDGVVVDVRAAAADAPEPTRSVFVAAAEHGPTSYGIAVGIGSDGLIHRISLAYPFGPDSATVVLDLFGYGIRDAVRPPTMAPSANRC